MISKMITALCRNGKVEIRLEADVYYCSCCGYTFDNTDLSSALMSLCMAIGVESEEIYG